MTTANSITVTALSIVTAAMQEIGALAAGESPSNDDLAWGLQKLQRLIDRYNAREPWIYANTFTEFTLVLGLSPHTIGPTPASGAAPTFIVNQRPVDIVSIGLVLTQNTDAPYVEIPMNKRDKDWWAAQTIKTLTSDLPTDFYYEPDWPNGSIYFWPVPTQANQVNIQTRTVLAEMTTPGQSFSMPPAYWDAVIYPLAISLCPSFDRQASPELINLSREAVKAVMVNNMRSTRLVSDSPSQTGSLSSRPDFSFLSGLSR